jgi:hypothetical protein
VAVHDLVPLVFDGGSPLPSVTFSALDALRDEKRMEFNAMRLEVKVTAPLVRLTLLLAVSGGPLAGEDCNRNGIDDGDDIRNGRRPDCIGNGIPDEYDLLGSRRVQNDPPR